jgi:putative tricarboxylic transport membrane protein
MQTMSELVRLRRLFLGAGVIAGLAVCRWADAAPAAEPSQCIVPAKPGGGMDLTCKLAQQALAGGAPLQIRYQPGGIGAVAWHSVVSQRRSEPDALVVFSGGSLLNLAERKYGQASTADVRWVAAVGTDYGMIAVRRDSPYHSLRDLIAAWKRNPSDVVIGASGTIGSQDWLKTMLLARQGGIEPRSLRFVAFEGGGESFTALLAGHVQVVSGDVSEAILHAGADRDNSAIRVLAVLAPTRFPGALATVPTAREQGFDVVWPIIRGFYMGPQVSDANYQLWVNRFAQAMARPEFDRLRAAHGLFPFAMTGAVLSDYVRTTVNEYSRQARELGLVR